MGLSIKDKLWKGSYFWLHGSILTRFVEHFPGMLCPGRLLHRDYDLVASYSHLRKCAFCFLAFENGSYCI